MSWDRWRRLPEYGACDWCLMLATRGAVYASETTALGNSGEYHGHCRCAAELEGSFDARKDVAIHPEDASRVIEYTHNESGKHYVYEIDDRGNILNSSSSWSTKPPKQPMPAPVKPTGANAASRSAMSQATTQQQLDFVDHQIRLYESRLPNATDVQRAWQVARLAELRRERAELAAALA